MVVICDSTRRLLGNLFELEDLGPKDLKGIAGPARAWAALRASSVESRFEAMHASGLTALVGRGRIRIAAAALVQSKDGRRPGGVALRRGRHRQIAAHGRAFGTPRHRAAHALALFLLAAAHRQRVLSDHRPDGTRRRTAHDDTPQAKLDKLDAMLAQTSTSMRTRRSLPRCCRCRTMDAIRRSI